MKKIEIKIEVEKKTFIIFLSGILIILSGFFLIKTVKAALICNVTDTCVSPNVVVFRMSGTTNAHAEMRTQSTAAYDDYLVCCGNVAGLGVNCFGAHELLGTLSGAANAHFEDKLNTVYNSANDICLSIDAGTVSAATSTSCAGYDTTVFEMSGTSGTNAHVGDASAPYDTKICASAVAAVVSVVLDQEIFSYGYVPDNTSSSTLNLWGGAGIIATNGNALADFDIYGANTTGSGSGWTLAGNTTGNSYMHQFCQDTDNDCATPPTNYVGNELTTSPAPLKASVAPAGTVAFQLRITTPTAPTDVSQQSAVVTIQATAP